MKIGNYRRGASLAISKRTERLVAAQQDGFWPLTVGQRLDQVHRLATALDRVVLPCYVRVSEAVIDPAGWVTVDAGYVRGTAIRSVRALFDRAPSDPEACVARRVLGLVAARKWDEPTLRWPDMADVALWPVALRVDAKRLADRLATLGRATWCRACDDAPWASASQHCLWCERMAPPPPRAWT